MFNDDFNDEELSIPNIVEKLEEATSAYYNNNESPMSDEDFDNLKDLLKKVSPNHPFLSRIGSPVEVSDWKKATHKIPMGSLNKVNSISEFKTWVKQCEAKEFLLSVKLDGISIDLEYEKGKLIKAITRGDGIVGEDILSNVIQMKNVKSKIKDFTGSIRGEIVIHKEDFVKLNEESAKNGDRVYKNLRNSASGISKNYEGKYAKHCTVLYYDILSDVEYDSEIQKFDHIVELGLTPCYWRQLTSFEECLSNYKQFEDGLREEYPYELDGLVIAVDDLNKQKELGFAYGNKKGAIAWKFGAIEKETEIIGIEWQVGNNRRITPVAKLKPVNVAGVTIENASLSNVTSYAKLKLGMNDRVIISRRNDVIPFLERVVEHVGKKFEYPEKCPECSHETELDGKFLICGNDNCSALFCGNLFKWVDKLELMDISYSTIEKLYKNMMVITPDDFYRLSSKEFASLEGLGEKSAKKFFDQLHAKMEIDLPTFIGGLNMANFSTSICERLMNAGYDTLDKLFTLDLNTLCKIPGIKEKISGKIINGLLSKKEIIQDLLNVGIKIKSEGKVVNKVSNHLDGKAFVFTGAINEINPETGKTYKREELQKMVSERGGINHSSVTKNTNYLVQASPDSSSSKSQKAIKLGCKILGEKEFFKMLEG